MRLNIISTTDVPLSLLTVW